jgi:hypothetical protein
MSNEELDPKDEPNKYTKTTYKCTKNNLFLSVVVAPRELYRHYRWTFVYINNKQEKSLNAEDWEKLTIIVEDELNKL